MVAACAHVVLPHASYSRTPVHALHCVAPFAELTVIMSRM